MTNRSDARTVYSTETGRICPNCGQPVDRCRCVKKNTRPVGDSIVRVSLDKKGRKGKAVTLVSGLPFTDEQIKVLAADLKRRCGTGGTVKDGVIEIQGDQRDMLVTLLKEKGLQVKKAGG